MALTRHVPIMWHNPPSWSRQGWDMNTFNPEHQLNTLDREMRDMNLRSGMRDLNIRADDRFASTRSDFDRWASTSRDVLPFRPTPLYDSDFNTSMHQMDWNMKRMADEMNRIFQHCQRLIPVDAHPDSWRMRENFLLENPIIQDRDGQRKYQLQFDVRQFKPEEIMVKTVGRELSVHARHEEKGDGRSVFREYHRVINLPTEMNPESLASKLSRDGLLSIEASLPAVEESIKLIPIEHKK